MPDRITITPGQQASFNITIESKQNINADVSLTVSGLPPNVTSNFPMNLTSTASSATLTVQTTPQTPLGTYMLTVTVAEQGGGEITLLMTLIVTESGEGVPDFSLELSPMQVTLGELSPTITYFVRPLNGYTGTVNVSVSGLTDDVVLLQPPTPSSLALNQGGFAGRGGTFVLSFQPTPPVNSPVILTVTVTDGTITRMGAVTLNLPGAVSPGG